MKILAFDTAMNACSVAITEGTLVLHHVHEKRRRGHAEALLPMIEASMRETGLGYPDIDLIAVTVGPGTFTGLRIGLAAARGIALAAKKPLIGVTTLEAISAAVSPSMAAGRPVIATGDARRGEIYLQAFMRIENDLLITPLTDAAAVKTEDALASVGLDRAVLAGSGAPLLAAQGGFDPQKFELLAINDDPDAIQVARLAFGRGCPPADTPPPAPVYLRAPDAKLPGGKDPAAS